MSPDALQPRYAEVAGWFQQNGPKIVESQQLQRGAWWSSDL